MPSNTYSYLTRAQAETLLGERLADPNHVRFLADELDLYLIDALRTFNALTGMWQLTDNIQPVPAGSAFLDLTSLFPALRGFTVHDQDLIGIMEYHLLEPKSLVSWLGSEMFTMDTIVQALQERRDHFLLQTGCHLSRHAPVPSSGVITSGDGEVAIDPAIIDIRRAAWTSLTGKTQALWNTSNWALRGHSANWNLEPGTPQTYAFNQYAPTLLQLAPPPNESGTLDLLTIDSGATLNPFLNVLIGIPDDFTPFIKWGALATLLAQDGPARDYPRSLFCERRYQIGVAAARIATVLIDARFNDQLAQFSSLQALDAAPTQRYWQSRPASTPKYIAPVGLNLLAIAPPTAANSVVALELTIVTNAPVPALSGDYLQIPPAYLDVILGYTQHLAMFKYGGKELAATSHLADAFFNAAIAYNDRLAALSVFEDDQRVFSQSQERAKPRKIRREASINSGDQSQSQSDQQP